MSYEKLLFEGQKSSYVSAYKDADLVNSLYRYNDTHPNKPAIMVDLCEALMYDEYIPLLDTLFKLPPYSTAIELYKQEFKDNLAAITTLANTHWERVFQWLRIEHLRSKKGINYFEFRKFVSRLEEISLFKADIVVLLKELDATCWLPANKKTTLARLSLGHMPFYFTEDVKQMYKQALLTKKLYAL